MVHKRLRVNTWTYTGWLHEKSKLSDLHQTAGVSELAHRWSLF